MNALPGLQLVNVSSIFPDKNLLIGGSLTLKSDSLLLTCFHGSNFRAQTWALFSINEPIVRYSSEMHCIEKSCQVERAFSVQRISIQLGNDGHDGPATEKTGEGGTCCIKTLSFSLLLVIIIISSFFLLFSFFRLSLLFLYLLSLLLFLHSLLFHPLTSYSSFFSSFFFFSFSFFFLFVIFFLYCNLPSTSAAFSPFFSSSSVSFFLLRHV